MTDSSLFSQATQFQENGESFAIVTILRSHGHAPGAAGAKAIVTKDGLQGGTIGGGNIEAKACSLATDMCRDSASAPRLQIFNWNLQTDIGMTCGGSVEVLIELFPYAPWRIAIFGAGHVAQALCRTLLSLDVSIRCFDTREEWLARLPQDAKLQAIHCEQYDQYCDDLEPMTDCVVITQGQEMDLPVLAKIMSRQDLGYRGVIGSKVKARTVKASLSQLGITDNQLTSLRCPMGLVRETYQPVEIALSIAAELLDQRRR
jgi:xanthine dehydrogenase accessory factor